MMVRAGLWQWCCKLLRRDVAVAFAALVALAAPLPAPVALAAPAATGSPRPQQGLKVVPLAIHSGRKVHRYQVEVAQTAEQQAIGMMYRHQVPEATGMIFPMNPPRQASFWMRNTLVPLDLLFIGADGRIRNIIADAVPLSEAPLSSLGEVAAVLELAGGEAARKGIKPGDRVRW